MKSLHLMSLLKKYWKMSKWLSSWDPINQRWHSSSAIFDECLGESLPVKKMNIGMNPDTYLNTCLNWQVTLGIPLVLKIRRQSKVSGLSIRTCLASVATMTNSSRIWINIGSADGSMDFFKIETPFSVLLIFRSWLIA